MCRIACCPGIQLFHFGPLVFIEQRLRHHLPDFGVGISNCVRLTEFYGRHAPAFPTLQKSYRIAAEKYQPPVDRT